MKNLLLLRIARRNSSWESLSASDIYDAEFRRPDGAPDLNLSIYEFSDEKAMIVQVFAEHFASLLGPKPPNRTHVDLRGSYRGPVLRIRGSGHFAFTRQAHRDLEFCDMNDILDLIDSVRASLDKSMRRTERSEVEAYIRQRIELHDEEWMALCVSDRRWRRYLPPNH